MAEMKKILIVDDSEIDRAVLKSILDDEFEVQEVDKGYSALEMILNKKESIDAILLDVSMPLLDGLSVLRILRESGNDITIFMITSEATKENVEEAAQYNIVEFIKKPFDKADILKRVRTKLNVEEKKGLTKAEMDEMRQYAFDLECIYNRHLKLIGKDKEWDERRARFMEFMLKHYPSGEEDKEKEIADFKTEMLCKAVYLCNIGNMFLQNGSEKDETAEQERDRQHPSFGADMVRLNYSKLCRWFVKTCADICLYHHERYDGTGFPHGLKDGNIPVYAQMCGLLEAFDKLFYPYSRHNEMQFDYVIGQLKRDTGFVSETVFSLLVESKADIIKYYLENYARG